MNHYRKSIVAFLAFAVIAAKQAWGIDLGIDPGTTADAVINLATAGGAVIGVYGLRNE